MSTSHPSRLRAFFALTACLSLAALTAGAATTNLALGKNVTASTTESSTYSVGKAVDGDRSTRWASTFEDNNWITIDLGANYMFTQVVLDWEAAYAKTYKIQTSTDNARWTDIHAITSYSSVQGQGGVETIDKPGNGRYVRMLGLTRATQYGYSLFEFKVMGEPTPGPNITTQPAPITIKEGQTATFTAAATGTGTLTYQWYRTQGLGSTFQAISGATSANYTTPVLRMDVDDGSQFYLRVTGTGQIYTDSAPGTLTVKGLGPDITSQPASANVAPGATAKFTVQATGAGTLTYQWQISVPNSTTFTPITGATASSYTTAAMAESASGTRYRVVVTDTSTGYPTTSAPATLSVNDADARAAAIVAQMTQAEKVRMVAGISDNLDTLPHGCIGYTEGLPRLGIPNLYLADGGLGVRVTGGRSTALPSGLAGAASWDLALNYDYGKVVGKDMRAHGFNISLSGNVNLIGREPRCGRAFETKGEDPILAGRANAAQIQGIQDQKVVACIKHFAVNDQETNRGNVNMVLDERSLRQTDLLAFEIGVKESTVGSVMAGYNKVNGEWCAENNHLLNEVLKGDWAFKGFVMSDWWGTHSGAKSANAGLDLEMPSGLYFGSIGGAISQARLDDMVKRILRSLIAAGCFDDVATATGQIDVGVTLPIAQKVAEEGTVLLKNINNQLPLKPALLKTVAVIGPHADKYVIAGGGSAIVLPVGGGELSEGGSAPVSWAQIIWLPSSPLNAIKAKLGAGTTVVFDDGSDPARAATVAKNADVAIIFAPQWTTENMDLPSVSLVDVRHGGDQLHLDSLISSVSAQNQRTVVVLETNGAVTMPWINNVNAVLAAWYPGQKGAEAIANILFGQVNPSAKLPITFPKSNADLPFQNIPQDTADYTALGLNIGYKYYDAKNIEPLFPFGHGLSYTTFAMTNATKVWSGNALTVEFDITNTGTVEGAEVAQVYLSMPADLNEPPKRLIGWKKVKLAAGASTHVSLPIDSTSAAHPFSYYDVASKSWKTSTKSYEVFLGNSSRSLNTLGTFVIGTDTLNLSKSSLSFASTAGTDTVAVTSNVSWTVTNVPSWLTVTPLIGANNATITFKAAAATTARSATVTVAGGTISRLLPITQAGTPNTPPSITTIANQSVRQDTSTGALSFTIGDAETPAANLILAAASDKPTLIPPAQIAFGGSGANRTVTVTPATGEIGTATVTITVTDADNASTSTAFSVTVNGVPTPVILDRNHNGMSDIWEALYPTAGGPTADSDGDGVTNLDEAQAGTSPISAASRFAATTAVDASGNLVLRWLGIKGKRYLIETSSDLRTWTPLATDYTGTGADISAIVRPVGTSVGTRSFWHVVVFDLDSTGSGGLNDWEKTHPEVVATIAATAGTNGGINPSGTQYVAKGSSLAFAISPAAGYVIDQVLVDSTSAGAVGTYTFSAISAGAHSIAASFKPDGSLRVSPTSLNLAGTATLTVTSLGAWTASSSHTWITVTPSGTGNGAITVSASVNPGATARNAVISVSGPAGSGVVVAVPVTQGPVSNLAFGKQVTASSEESGHPAAHAVDADATTTRWGSSFSDPQWIMVDLGSTYRFSQVVLVWEAAYGKAYEIQVSSNKTTWTPIYSTTTGDGGTDTIDFTATARYVRMYGTQRNTAYGYSVYDFRVMGNPADVAPMISTEPIAQLLREGQTATFTVAATGQGALTYQWFRAVSGSTSFAALSGASSASYTTPVLVQGVDNGAQYRVQVTDSTSNIDCVSAVALLTVKGLGPDITKQPTSQSVMPGETATFAVEASGVGSLSYQWYRANPGSTTFTPIGGAIASSYTTPAFVYSTDNGASFRVVVKDNSNGYSTTSNSASFGTAKKWNHTVTRNGHLTAQGNGMVNKNGTGLSLGGNSWFWSHDYKEFWNPAIMEYLVTDWKMQVARMPMAINPQNHRTGNDFTYVHNKPYALAQMCKMVDKAIELDIYVIIDFHEHDANNNRALAEDFFRELGKRYGKCENVLWEIFNEPLGGDTGQIVSYANFIIPIIREYSDNMIIVGTPEWSSKPSAMSGVNGANIAYTFHYYASMGHSDYGQLTCGKPVMITECGMDGGNMWKFIELAKANNQITCPWSVCNKQTSAGDGPDSLWSIFNEQTTGNETSWTDANLSDAGKTQKGVISGWGNYYPPTPLN